MIALARWQGAVPHRLAARPHTWQPDPLQPTPLCCLACLPHTSWLQRRLPPAVLALRWLQQQLLRAQAPVSSCVAAAFVEERGRTAQQLVRSGQAGVCGNSKAGLA
jgi:hypothetical protein